MRTGLIRSLAVLTLVTSSIVAATELKTEEDKAMYALGAIFGRNAAPLYLTPAELELVKEGFSDAALGKKVQVANPQSYGPRIGELQKTRAVSAGKAYEAKAAAEKGVTKTASGVLYSVIKPGNGASPKATDTVKVNYVGSFTSGAVFDRSAEGKPAEFQLDGVIKCWTEGVQLMKVGGKSRLVCPSAIAYGESGNQGIPPNSTLVFEIELLAINGKP